MPTKIAHKLQRYVVPAQVRWWQVYAADPKFAVFQAEAANRGYAAVAYMEIEEGLWRVELWQQ